MKTIWRFFLLLWILSGAAFAQHEGHNMPGMIIPEENSGAKVSPNQVQISAERQHLIGVKTETAALRSLKKIIRTVGTVAYDAELYSAQNEYSQAVEAREKARESGDVQILQNAEELSGAAYLKLKRMGLSDDLILKTEKSDSSLIVGSENGMVWIYAKIYENEIPLIKKGMMAHITSKNMPDKMFMGKIASIDTVIDEITRSLRARIAVKNENGALKPNMYVDVVLELPLGVKLAVPEEAVMDTGEKQIVFVDDGKEVFEERKITVGQKAEGYVEILKGLKSGEKVVTSGNFLIDSESKMKSTGGGGHVH